MMKNYCYTLFFIIIFTFSASAFAKLSATVDRHQVSLGETFKLTLATNAQTYKSPDLTKLKKDFDIFGIMQNNEVSVINNRTVSRTAWVVTLSPKRTGTLQIPSLMLGTSRSLPITVNVAKTIPTSQGDQNDKQKGDVFFTVKTSKNQLYVDSQLLLAVRLFYRVSMSKVAFAPPRVENATIKQLGKPITYRTIRRGQPYGVYETRFVIFPKKSGPLRIAPAMLRAYIRKNINGAVNFDQLFNNAAMEPIHIIAPTVHIKVKAKPKNIPLTQWLPSSKVTLKDSFSSALNDLHLGTPITRTISLSADGVPSNRLPSLTQHLAIPGLKTYPDKPVLNTYVEQDGLTSTKTQKIAIIPNKTGKITLPAVKIHWYNTKTHQPETAYIPEKTLTILPLANTNKIKTAALSQPTHKITKPASKISPTAKPSQKPLVKPSKPAILPKHAIASPNTFKSLLNIQHAWVWLVILGLLLLWVITLIAWWLGRQKIKKNQVRESNDALTQTSESRTTALREIQKKIKRASKAGDLVALVEALIQWAKYYFPQQSIRNIGDISKLISDADFKKSLQSLSEKLYKSENIPWDNKQFCQAFEAAEKSIKRKPDSKQSDTLPPLYR